MYPSRITYGCVSFAIWIGKMIAGLDVSAPQLLLNQAVVSVPMLLIIAPFVDAVPDLSKSLSFPNSGLNGRNNGVKRIKTITIISISWYLEGRLITVRDVCDVSLAIGGAYAYAVLSQKY
jgi:solute carrier family 35, member E3